MAGLSESKKILEKFMELMYVNLDEIKDYKLMKNHTIFIRFLNGKQFVFTYFGPLEWRIETAKMFEKSIENDSKKVPKK